MSRTSIFIIIGIIFSLAGYIYVKKIAEADTIINPVAQTEIPSEQPVVEVSKEPERPKQFRVGIQAGHWKNDELPNELKNLRDYGGGSTVGTTTEWEVNLSVAKKVAAKLEAMGYIVDLLPATVPQDYSADAFVSIHSDGNDDPSVTGYQVAASEYDRSGLADTLSESISNIYGVNTKLRLLEDVSVNMRRYYAFNFVRFVHSITPKTPAVIIEIGFLTNTHDRQFMLSKQDLIATSIAQGVATFFEQTN